VVVAGAAAYVTGRAFADPATVGTVAYAVAAAAVLTGASPHRRKFSVPAATSGPAAATEGGKESNRPPTPKAWDS
jgi:hypothetical protein